MQDVSYQWDAVGNLLTRGDATQSLSESFGYDSLNRVTSAIVAGGPAKTFAYDSIGNITAKSDVGTYTYPLPGSARPHAVIEVAGSLNATYSYDANGNLVSGAGRTVTYASFNLPTQITRGAVAVSFSYGPEHQRITQVAPDSTTVYLHPAGSGAPFIEKVVMGATVQWNNYIYANGAMVGVLYERNPGGVFTRYFHKDHLGSIAVITDETGAVLERLSYDAWGKRRFPNGADDPAETITSQSDRGFTGHEHLADVGLIHMNGRIYDPVLGRFMTADPVIQEPFSTQNFNRYAYVLNNPLAYTDPDGYLFKGIVRAIRNFISGIVSNPRMIIAIAVAIIIPQVAGAMMMEAAASAAYATANVVGNGFVVANTAFATAVIEVGAASTLTGVSASLTTVGAMTAAAAGGFTAGVITGGSLESGLKGAIAGAATVAIGSALSSTELAGFAKGIPARMIGGGVNGALQTGDARGFLRGFLAGALPNDLGFTQAYKNDPWANIGIGVARGGLSGAIVGGRDGILRGIALSQVNNAVGHVVGGTLSGFQAPRFSDGAFIYDRQFLVESGAITFGNVISGSESKVLHWARYPNDPTILEHELRHVPQSDIFGALYIPVHGIMLGVSSMLPGGHHGPFNPLECSRSWISVPAPSCR